MNRNSPHEAEVTHWAGSPSKRVAIFAPLVYCAIVAALLYYFPNAPRQIALYISQMTGRRDFWIEYTAYIAAFVFVAPSLWSYLVQVTTKYECTTERLIIRKGIIVRTEDEVELYRVVDVVQTVNVLQQLVGVGTVMVKSTDHTGDVLLASITGSSNVRNVIRTSAEECKTRRGTIRLLNEGGAL